MVFEERVTRNLCEDLRTNIEATRQDFETQLAALEARTRRAGGSRAGANADKVKTAYVRWIHIVGRVPLSV
jgi:hypothetical protein